MKISGEIICQSWLLLTPFFNFLIVNWVRWSRNCTFVLLFLSVSESIFLWLVIRSTVAITGVMMGISLIYNPWRLLLPGGLVEVEVDGQLVAKWGVLVSKITHTHSPRPCYYLPPKVKVAVMMTVVAVVVIDWSIQVWFCKLNTGQQAWELSASGAYT